MLLMDKQKNTILISLLLLGICYPVFLQFAGENKVQLPELRKRAHFLYRVNSVSHQTKHVHSTTSNLA